MTKLTIWIKQKIESNALPSNAMHLPRLDSPQQSSQSASQNSEEKQIQQQTNSRKFLILNQTTE